MHIGSIFAPILVPAVVYVLSRRISFVRSHAFQALYETIVLNILLFVVGTVSLCYTAFRLWNFYQNDWQGFSWFEMVVRFAVGWLLLGLLGLINTAISLRQAYQAYQGEWPTRETRKALRQAAK